MRKSLGGDEEEEEFKKNMRNIQGKDGGKNMRKSLGGDEEEERYKENMRTI